MAGETDGFVKIVADKKYDEMLGVHMIGLRSTELVAEATARAAARVDGRGADSHDSRASDDGGGGRRSGARDARRGDPQLREGADPFFRDRSSRESQTVPTTPDSAPSTALTRNQRLELYYYARLTRDIEERVNILHRQGKVTGAVYRSLGQEGESVATAYALNRDDALSPLTRNLGALLTMGVRPLVMFLQYMAKGTSAARGRDLSNHFANIPAAGVERADPHRTRSARSATWSP